MGSKHHARGEMLRRGEGGGDSREYQSSGGAVGGGGRTVHRLEACDFGSGAIKSCGRESRNARAVWLNSRV